MGRYMFQVLMEPEDDNVYSVYVPDLPGCVTCGDGFCDSVAMASDSLRTFVSSLLADGKPIPEAREHQCPEGWKAAWISFETNDRFLVRGPVVSASEAARRLGVSRGRVSHMLKDGVLDGYRELRNTYVTVESIDKRLASNPKPGRPMKKTSSEAAKGRDVLKRAAL